MKDWVGSEIGLTVERFCVGGYCLKTREKVSG